jgi:hypothetical protein
MMRGMGEDSGKWKNKRSETPEHIAKSYVEEWTTRGIAVIELRL